MVEERRPAEVTGEGGEAPAEGACAGEAASRIGLGFSPGEMETDRGFGEMGWAGFVWPRMKRKL